MGLPPALRAAAGWGRAVQGCAALPCCAPLSSVAPFPSLSSTAVSADSPAPSTHAVRPRRARKRPHAARQLPCPPGAGRCFHSLHSLRHAALRSFVAAPCCAPHSLRLLRFTRFSHYSPVPPLSPPHRFSSYPRHPRLTPRPTTRTAAVPRKARKKPSRRPSPPPDSAAGHRPKSLPPASKACISATQAEARPASRRFCWGAPQTPAIMPRPKRPGHPPRPPQPKSRSTLKRPALPSNSWGQPQTPQKGF